MKTHLLLFLLPAILFMSCGKSEDEPTPIDVEPGFEIHMKKKTTLPTGTVVINSTEARFIHIWKADGLDLVFETHMSIQGYGWDLITQKPVAADYKYANMSDVYENVPPGYYIAWVMLPVQPDESIPTTGIGIEVKKGRKTVITKIFKAGFRDHESWEPDK